MTRASRSIYRRVKGRRRFARRWPTHSSTVCTCIVYMNQRLWGMTTRSWTEQRAEQFAVKDAEGTVTPEVYNTFMKVPCASMCMGTDFWRTKYAEIAAEAVCTLGVDGIYMDQACSSLACYDPRMVIRWAAVPGGWTAFSSCSVTSGDAVPTPSKWFWPAKAAARRGYLIWT